MDTRSKDYRKLQAEWDRKLKKSGFEDIEQRNGEFKNRVTSNGSPSRLDPATFEAWQTYYRLAGQFLHEHQFDSPIERQIWELHADGLSAHKIAVILKKQRIRKKSHDTISIIIRRLADEMVKKYNEQDN